MPIQYTNQNSFQKKDVETRLKVVVASKTVEEAKAVSELGELPQDIISALSNPTTINISNSRRSSYISLSFRYPLLCL